MSKLTCPSCGSHDVTTSTEQMFYANSGEHFCWRVKSHDADAPADCLTCDWRGMRRDLVEISRKSKKNAVKIAKGENQ